MANGNLVTLLNTESRRDVCGKVLVSLLVSGVLGDELKVLAADDDGSVHLRGDDGAGQDTATDRDETGEGALLVCVGSKISIASSTASSISLPQSTTVAGFQTPSMAVLIIYSQNSGRLQLLLISHP